MGNSSRPFKGSFDGCFKAFSNVTVSVGIFGGLFGDLGNGGSISNVYLSESNINGGYNAGGIAGYSEGTIENCHVQESVTISGESMVGGIVGTSKGSVNYCENKATVSGTSTQVGGIVGSMISGKVTGCLNEGNVSSENAYVGGIVGQFNNAIIEECINTGTVSSNNYAVGGIVGYGSGYSSNNRINRCLNLAQVEGNRSVGGIIGYFYEGNVTYEGNYYAGECNVGGISGSDEAGAGRGYIISNDDDVYADIFPIDEEEGTFVGITYDGIRYVGAGETTKLLIEKSPEAPEGIIAASAGILKPLDEEYYDEINDVFYLLTMPSEGGDVNLSITEGVGLTVAGYDESAKSGWKFIASPVVCDVAARTVSNIFGATEYDLYRFNQSEDLEWRNYKTQPFELENGKGYLYASKEDATLVFRGTTYNTAETMEVPLTYDQNATLAGWNLVGNPFPRAAYIDKSYYKLNDDGSVIVAEPVLSATYISPCHGVFVQVDENETVTFSTTAPTQQNAANNGGLQIALTQANMRSNAMLDNAIVSFGEGQQLGKFRFGRQNANIYIPQDGKDYAIASVGRDAARHVSTEMPLNFKANKDGTYTLSINPENVEMDYLHLIDNLTGADVDLLAGNGGDARHSVSTYTFDAKTTDYESRFKLVFAANNGAANDDNASFAFISNDNIIVNGEGTLQVIDATGRVIRTVGLSQCGSRTTTAGMTPGVYVLRLIKGETVRTQKIMIR